MEQNQSYPNTQQKDRNNGGLFVLAIKGEFVLLFGLCVGLEFLNQTQGNGIRTLLIIVAFQDDLIGESSVTELGD